MSINWPSNERLDALMRDAEKTRSRSLVFDPESPDGFRPMTLEEDRQLIESIALPHQRHDDDREHLTREQDQAERVGDRDGADTATAHLEVLDDERARDQRADPRLPSREQIDRLWERGEQVGWSEPTARAVEYLDARRTNIDERAEAYVRGDHTEVHRIDRRQDRLDRNLREYLDPEREDEERER